MSIKIEIGGRRYPLDDAFVAGARVAEARHAPGTRTVEHRCARCSAMMLLDVAKLELAGRTARPVLCLQCAVRLHPETLVGTHAGDGHAITLREAVEQGWIRLDEGRVST
jgi:hypothetical protein